MEVTIKKLIDESKPPSKEFQREAHVLAQMKHENVLKLEGVSLLMAPFYIIAEFLGRGDLLTLLQVDGGNHLKIKELTDIAKQA